jgi:membrane protein implicated in regulation of membrane protease activity
MGNGVWRHAHASFGLARMPPARFGIYTVLGCIPWTAALALAGYLVGKNWANVASALHGPSLVLGGLLVLLVLVAIVLLWRRRRRERSDHTEHNGHREHNGQDGGGEPASTARAHRGRGG